MADAKQVTAWDEKGIPIPSTSSATAWDEKGVPIPSTPAKPAYAAPGSKGNPYPLVEDYQQENLTPEDKAQLLPYFAGAATLPFGVGAGALAAGAGRFGAGKMLGEPTKSAAIGGAETTAGTYLGGKALGMIPKVIAIGKQIVGNGGGKEIAADMLEKYVSKNLAKRIAPEFYENLAAKETEKQILASVRMNERALQASARRSEQLEKVMAKGKAAKAAQPSTVSPEYQPPLGKVTLQSMERKALVSRIKNSTTPYQDRRLYIEELLRNPGNIPESEVSRLSKYVIGPRAVVPWRNPAK